MIRRADGMLGLNIHAMGVDRSPRGWDGLYSWIERLQPAYCLVMDADAKRAAALQTRFPGMGVILRVPYEGDADWRALAPDAWMQRFGRFSEKGIILQYLNEPSGYAAIHELRGLAARCIELMKRAEKHGARLALPNFGVGHPSYQSIHEGAFDEMLEAVTKGGHILAVHEYARARADESDFIGRFRAFQARAQTLGLPALKIVLTETGRDEAGRPEDGWRARMSADQYAELLIGIGRKAAELGASGACIFGYGFLGDVRWGAFDVSSPELLERLVQQRVPTEGGTADQRPPLVGKLRTASPFVNIRSAPEIRSDNIIGHARAGQTVHVLEDVGGWMKVKIVQHGYISKQNGRVYVEPDLP